MAQLLFGCLPWDKIVSIFQIVDDDDDDDDDDDVTVC